MTTAVKVVSFYRFLRVDAARVRGSSARESRRA